jgi:hypothetical protein
MANSGENPTFLDGSEFKTGTLNKKREIFVLLQLASRKERDAPQQA